MCHSDDFRDIAYALAVNMEKYFNEHKWQSNPAQKLTLHQIEHELIKLKQLSYEGTEDDIDEVRVRLGDLCVRWCKEQLDSAE